jgi:hypothetical protein
MVYWYRGDRSECAWLIKENKNRDKFQISLSQPLNNEVKRVYYYFYKCGIITCAAQTPAMVNIVNLFWSYKI